MALLPMEKMSLTTCPMSKRLCTPTKDGKFRKHGPAGGECEMSRKYIPGREEEVPCESHPSAETRGASSAESSPEGVNGTAESATTSTSSSPPSPEPAGDAPTASVSDVL